MPQTTATLLSTASVENPVKTHDLETAWAEINLFKTLPR